MATKILSFLSVLFIPFILSAQSGKKAPVHIGLVYPLSSNGTEAAEYSNNFSLHAIAGVSRSERSFCAAGVTNVVMEDVEGFAGAGFSNHVFNTVNGSVVAGFANTVSNEVYGFMGAGFLNYCGSIEGGQAAGFANISTGNTTGLQAAGFLNTSKNTDGVQVGGFVNISKNINGLQAAGFANIAQDANTQLAGFINIAKRVEGVQLSGFINIADSSDYPIGIVNIVKNGEKGIGFTFDDNQTGLISFRSGGKVLYGILGAGYNFKNKDRQDLFALEAGIGAHFHIVRGFRINTELATTDLTDFRKGNYIRSSVRILPSLKIGETIDIFAGVSFNHVTYSNSVGETLNEHYVWSSNRWQQFNGLYFGYMGGIQFNF